MSKKIEMAEVSYRKLGSRDGDEKIYPDLPKGTVIVHQRAVGESNKTTAIVTPDHPRYENALAAANPTD